MSEFSEKYKFDPNTTAKQIASEQLLTFAELVKGTPNEDFIAYKDPKVQELVDFIMSAIILENERINEADFYPIQIYRRYKSDNSLKDKMLEWAGRPEKAGMQVTDYLGFKIIPEAEHSVFFSGGDSRLQQMINKRESIRSFIVETYKNLSEQPNMSFREYCLTCNNVIDVLMTVFPEECDSRRAHYAYLGDLLNDDLNTYNDMVEDSTERMPLSRISKLTSVNIKKLLTELTLCYPNQVTLYKLKSNLLNTFANSELLRAFGISVSDNQDRTKTKITSNRIYVRIYWLRLNYSYGESDRQ